MDFEEIERVLLLRAVDSKWMDHIDAMDALRQGIGLKAYGNQDPIIAYKKEGFDMFDEMVGNIQEMAVSMLMRVNIERAPKREENKVELKAVNADGQQNVAQKTSGASGVAAKPKSVGRNDPCPCGSGKKYKNCCGKNA